MTEFDDNSELNLEDKSGCFTVVAPFGLAIYALMIISIGLSAGFCGLTTMFGSWQQDADHGRILSSGIGASQWRLQELRRFDLIERSETPTLYHDHSFMADGSGGCYVLNDTVTRWDNGLFTASANIIGATISGDGSEVTIQNDGDEVTCPFGMGQGGDDFFSMLETTANSAAQ
jgi:hypothetical protein